METIDLTPTWGEWANIYARFAETGGRTVCKGLRADLARMAAAAQALRDIQGDAPDALKARIARTICAELEKQGYGASDGPAKG